MIDDPREWRSPAIRHCARPIPSPSWRRGFGCEHVRARNDRADGTPCRRRVPSARVRPCQFWHGRPNDPAGIRYLCTFPGEYRTSRYPRCKFRCSAFRRPAGRVRGVPDRRAAGRVPRHVGRFASVPLTLFRRNCDARDSRHGATPDRVHPRDDRRGEACARTAHLSVPRRRRVETSAEARPGQVLPVAGPSEGRCCGLARRQRRGPAHRRLPVLRVGHGRRHSTHEGQACRGLRHRQTSGTTPPHAKLG